VRKVVLALMLVALSFGIPLSESQKTVKNSAWWNAMTDSQKVNYISGFWNGVTWSDQVIKDAMAYFKKQGDLSDALYDDIFPFALNFSHNLASTLCATKTSGFFIMLILFI